MIAASLVPSFGANNINAPALTLFGIIITGIVAIIVEMIRTRNRVDDVKTRVEPVSNGFSKDVIDRLERIETRLTDHIEWHLSRKG